MDLTFLGCDKLEKKAHFLTQFQIFLSLFLGKNEIKTLAVLIISTFTFFVVLSYYFQS